LTERFTPQEKRNLSKILSRAVEPEDTLTLDGVHGLLFGLAVIPEPIMPSEWFPRIFGASSAEFEEKDDVEKWMGSLLGTYNRILAENEKGKLEFPFDMKDLREGDFDRIRHWAFGLFRAMSLRPETWGLNRDESALSEEDRRITDACCVIFGLARPEKIPDLFVKPPGAVTLYGSLPHAVNIIRDHGNRMRREMREQGIVPVPRGVRQAQKIGRNDPCPCGSGKKHKKCCG
jgi:uncharacterized protein